jgi:hypothetical protein
MGKMELANKQYILERKKKSSKVEGYKGIRIQK